jgi:hypothetical protein
VARYSRIAIAAVLQDSHNSLRRCNSPSYRRLCIWNPNKRRLKVPCCSEYVAYSFNCGRWLGRGFSAFFIRHFDLKDKQYESRDAQLTLHGNRLILQYEDFEFAHPKPAAENWRTYLSRFAYGTELLEHLYTGHRQLYDLLDSDEERFGEEFNRFLRANKVLVSFLAGACNHCLAYHDEKDIPRLREELSERR